MIQKKKAAGLLLAFGLAAGVPFSGAGAATKAPAKTTKIEYVALGDSLAAGQTPDGYIDYGYADYIYNNFKANKSYNVTDYDNFAVPGYTSVKLAKDLTKSTKIRSEIKSATHITIDIGANDLLAVVNSDTSKAPAVIAEVGKNLDTVLTKIESLNKKAKVYVMGYYNCFPYYPQEQQDLLMPLLKGLNTQIKGVAAKHKDTYVATDTTIAKNYKTYITNPKDIHLSKSGYKAIATQFWNAVKKK